MVSLMLCPRRGSKPDPPPAKGAVVRSRVLPRPVGSRLIGSAQNLVGRGAAESRNVVIDEIRRITARPWRRALTDDPESTPDAVGPADDAVIDTWLVEEALRRLRPSIGRRSWRPTCGSARMPRSRPRRACRSGRSAGWVFCGLKALRLTMDEMGCNCDAGRAPDHAGVAR